MRASRIVPVVMLAACLGVNIELLADMVVLRTNDRLNGKVVREEGETIALAYRDGTLAIARKYVEKVVKVNNLSEYGRKAGAPADEVLSNLAQRLIQAARRDAGPQIEPEGKPPAVDAAALRTVRHQLDAGGWNLSFELPVNWERQEIRGVVLFPSPGEESWASVCVAVLKNPPVESETQARINEAAVRAQLNSFSTIYSATRTENRSALHRHELTGIYGPEGARSVARIITRRTTSHTFVLAFFVSLQVYDQCEPVLSACQFSTKLERTGE